MKIAKVNIENFKCFGEKFSLSLNDGVNILVGNNEAGKSTILESIHLALTGVINGRFLKNELSQYLFNHTAVESYLNSFNSGGEPLAPPFICIEIFFGDDDYPLFEGNGNSERNKAAGISYKIEFDSEYRNEYEELIKSGELSTIPIEYYKVTWRSFARESVTPRSIPIKPALIDSSSSKYQNGSDVYISRIIQRDLGDKEKVNLSQAYRKVKDSFMNDESVKAINKKIKEQSKISDKHLKISVDLSSQNAWSNNLMTYLDEIPFHQIGKGEQCIIKTNLALSHHSAKAANLILLEEPENHLSHTKLNELIKNITQQCDDKQIIISTHNSFVANKLGIEHVVLLNNRKTARLSELKTDTYNFFRKLPGYQTLRLILGRKTVLVEGDSDELIFQKAYLQKNGCLPIENGIDVISVKLAFKRFLEIAKLVQQPVAVITDNDGGYANNITKKYEDYLTDPNVKICADIREDLNTLEPQFVDANKSDLEALCDVIGVNFTDYKDFDKITGYMGSNKTKWALKVFESKMELNYPQYILDAVRWCNDE